MNQRKADLIFFEHLEEEIKRARSKFPDQDMETTLLAAMEELGELAQAHLQKLQPHLIYEEALQVACMAMRAATEFDLISDNEELP